MSATVDAFFYGLYMDETVLAGAGVTPRSPHKASAHGYALKIGKRATLVKAPGNLAWGLVYALTQATSRSSMADPASRSIGRSRSRSRWRTAPSSRSRSTTCRKRRPLTRAIRSMRRSSRRR